MPRVALAVTCGESGGEAKSSSFSRYDDQS